MTDVHMDESAEEGDTRIWVVEKGLGVDLVREKYGLKSYDSLGRLVYDWYEHDVFHLHVSETQDVIDQLGDVDIERMQEDLTGIEELNDAIEEHGLK